MVLTIHTDGWPSLYLPRYVYYVGKYVEHLAQIFTYFMRRNLRRGWGWQASSQHCRST